MAITNNTLTRGGIRPANDFGSGGTYPSAPTWYGWVVENDSYPSGAPLILSGTAGELGLVDFGAAEIADDACFGVSVRMSPRRQDLAPLTSATAPATALPWQRTVPAAVAPDYANPADETSGILFHPFLPGMMFAAHHVTSAADNDGGSDRTSAAGNIYDGPVNISFGRTVTGVSNMQDMDYNIADEFVLLNTDANAIVGDHCVIMGFANPQPISTVAAVPGGPAVLNVGTQQNCLVFFTVVAAGSILF